MKSIRDAVWNRSLRRNLHLGKHGRFTVVAVCYQFFMPWEPPITHVPQSYSFTSSDIVFAGLANEYFSSEVAYQEFL